MKWLLEVNVILDVVADREPWADASARVLGLVERGAADGHLAAHPVTTLYDLLSTYGNPEVARRKTRVLLQLLTVIPVDEGRLLHALDLPPADYEDAVQVACAEWQGVDLIGLVDRALIAVGHGDDVAAYRTGGAGVFPVGSRLTASGPTT